jgi:parvulin-like peptidyl-prolyl isomerase
MNYRFKVITGRLLCAICVLAVVTSVWPGSAASEEIALNEKSGLLAVVDGKPITRSAFQEEMKRRPGVVDAESKKELLDSLVRSELLFAAAKRAGYEKDPAIIQAVKQLMVGRYLSDNLEKKQAQVKASEQELEAYYRANQARFGTRAMVHAAVIRIAVSPRAAAEKRAELLKRAETAREEALALEPGVPAFGDIAIKYSEDQDSRYRGGDIGWVQTGAIEGKWGRKVSEAVLSLKTPGEVSPVVHAQDGYYLVKLIEKKEAAVKPFAEVKDGVRYLLLEGKKARLENEFIEQLKSRIPVTVNSGLLETIPAPAEGNRGAPPALPAR